MKTIKAGSLTKNLESVQKELDSILENLNIIIRTLEKNKKAIISGVMTDVSPDAPSEEMTYTDDLLADNIDSALNGIAQAKSWVGRLNIISRNGIDIAKMVEKTWFDSLKDFVQESRWYREHYPEEYRKKQVEKEYQQFKLRPETFYGKPTSEDIERMRQMYKTDPFSFKKEIEQAQRDLGLKRKAQVVALQHIAEATEKVMKQIIDLITKYFSSDSSIVKDSDKLIQKVKSDKGRKIINPTLYEALGDKISSLETLFGYENQPGRFVVSGSRAFLVPAIQQLRHSIQLLYSPLEQAKEYRQTLKDIKDYQDYQKHLRDLEERKRRSEQGPFKYVLPPMKIREDIKNNDNTTEQDIDSEVKESRLQVLFERHNIIANRKKRWYIVQRIASSR